MTPGWTRLGVLLLFVGEWGEDITNMDLVDGNNHGPEVSWPALSSISPVGVRCATVLR